MNLAYPIQAILMYFAMLFAPDNVDRITLESPDPSKRIEIVRNGQTWSAEGNAFGIEGEILAIFGASGKESLKIGDFVTLPKNHDWNKNPEFTLGGGTTLGKTATGFILRRNSGEGVGNGTYKIVYHQPETQVGVTTVNVLGKVVNQGVHRISGSASVMTAIAAAGGPAKGADMKRISIVRGGGGAVTVALEFDLTVESGSGRGINAGDTVFVPALSEDDSKKPGGPEIGGLAAKWLAGIDAGNYAQSWEDAAESFQRAVTKEQWVEKSEQVRKPLGEVISRKLVESRQMTAFPGFPQGAYFEAQFDTSFAGLKAAKETLTFSQEKSGEWRVIGYLIKPVAGKDAEAVVPPEQAVVDSAEAWLKGIDAGNYARSWQDAAVFFKAAITEAGWNDALGKVRKPLGDVSSRKLLSATSTKSLPGAPDGEYLVIQFNTSFASKADSVETVTYMQEKDGTWKSSGYFIR